MQKSSKKHKKVLLIVSIVVAVLICHIAASFLYDNLAFVKSNNWRILGVIVKEVDAPFTHVTEGIIQIQTSMTEKHIQTAVERFKDLEHFLNTYSNGQMTAKVDTITINITLTNLSTCYLAPFVANEAFDLLESSQINWKNYDHIMIFSYLYVPASTGGYYASPAGLFYGPQEGTFLSEVRFEVPNLDNSRFTNGMFPEDALVHEFLHNLESMSRHRKTITILDDARYESDVYSRDSFRFYIDFMNQNVPQIDNTSRRIGLTPECYYNRKRKF